MQRRAQWDCDYFGKQSPGLKKLGHYSSREKWKLQPDGNKASFRSPTDFSPSRPEAAEITVGGPEFPHAVALAEGSEASVVHLGAAFFSMEGETKVIQYCIFTK